MPATIALVGDRSDRVRSHRRVPGILDGLGIAGRWVATDEVAGAGLEAYGGIWLLPGSPYRSEAGALLAARTGREQGVPLLATCGGFQHALLEYARTVCGLDGVAHAETAPDAGDLLIAPLECSLVGQEGGVTAVPGTRAGRLLGHGRTVERYHCSYGLNPAYVPVLEAHGMRFTGHDDDGEVRIAELDGHPFFLATLFQPELADGVHPFIRAFAAAVRDSAVRD
jgi:CTP synthase (UTP-ammonia lyase)